MLRWVIMVVAAVYTLAGIAALLVAFVLPSDDPLSAAFAILLGLPWTLLLLAFDPQPGDSSLPAALVTSAIILNFGALWWFTVLLARRRRHRVGLR